jgi:predicted unusual protein kinase regulating ubiquinone biosynthesis (AarF/ABC1/UbiB family)
MMKRDMSLLKTGAWLMSCLPGAEYLSLEEGAQQFSVNMMLQLDLRREAENLNKFNVNVREWGTRAVAVHFPELLHCMTPDTLVMSYERGIPMGQYVKLQRPKKERGELAAVGIDSFLRMMFQNFVHADLHPGNMLVRTGAGGNLELVCLDVGLVCELSPKDYANFIDLFRSVVTKNPRQGAELLLLRAHQQNCSDPELFKAEMCAIMEAVFDGPSRDIRVGVVLGDIFSCVRRHRVSLDPAFTTMAVSMVLVEGLGKELDPDAQLIEYAIPYFASFDLRRRWNRFVGRRWPSFRVSKKKNDAL